MAPQAHAITKNGALIILQVPLQPNKSIKSCNKGPITRTPMLPPTETIPTARDCHLRKFLAVMRKQEENMRAEPKPYRKLQVTNIHRRLEEYEANSKLRAHIRQPAIAVKRHPIVSQRADPRGLRKNVRPSDRDPTQTIIPKQTYSLAHE